MREGRTAVAVVVDDLLDARVVPVTFDHLAAPVRRAVVEQHYLEIGVGLREHRVDALPEIGRVTIVGNNDRNHRLLIGRAKLRLFHRKTIKFGVAFN